MNLLLDLHGPAALVLLAILLFTEEAGVPLPLVPGDLLLLAGGLLIANDTISPWAFFPVSFVAVLSGALAGYGWSRAVGSRGLMALAARFHAASALERVSRRLEVAGSRGIFVCRLLPGLRVYTTLVAGALQLGLRTFLVGAVPAIAVWITGLTFLGMLVGLPAVHLLNRVERLALDGIVLVAVAAVAYLGSRHIPAANTDDDALLGTLRPWRLSVALLLDGAIIIGMVSGLTDIAHDVLRLDDPDGLIDVAAITAGMIIGYLGIMRLRAGGTAGERLLGIRYHAAQRGHDAWQAG